MKKFRFLAAAIAVAVVFTGCDKGNDGGEQYSAVIDFESAVLAPKTGGAVNETYSNILWGLEKAAEQPDNSLLFDGVLHSEDGASFGSYYSNGWGSDFWSGFAVSSNVDKSNVLPDLDRQFQAYANGASKFAVIFDGTSGGIYANGDYDVPEIHFSKPQTVLSAQFANTNYVYNYCRENIGEMDDFWFKLTVTGYKGKTEAGELDIFLAEKGQVLSNWTQVDLSGLGEVDMLNFSFDSNDVGEYGLNPPAYVCIDNIKLK